VSTIVLCIEGIPFIIRFKT